MVAEEYKGEVHLGAYKHSAALIEGAFGLGEQHSPPST